MFLRAASTGSPLLLVAPAPLSCNLVQASPDALKGSRHRELQGLPSVQGSCLDGAKITGQQGASHTNRASRPGFQLALPTQGPQLQGLPNGEPALLPQGFLLHSPRLGVEGGIITQKPQAPSFHSGGQFSRPPREAAKGKLKVGLLIRAPWWEG